MSLDIRIPIGLLFAIIGAILVTYGLFSNPAMYQAIGINVNLWWGAVMLLFGIVMFVVGRRKAKQAR